VTQDPNSTVTSYLQGQLPELSQQNLTTVLDAYKVFASSSASAETNTFITQVAIFTEAVFVCPTLWLAEAFPKKAYQVCCEYNTNDVF
jgi:hypothetical protein